jgi:hypothetical protein
MRLFYPIQGRERWMEAENFLVLYIAKQGFLPNMLLGTS